MKRVLLNFILLFLLSMGVEGQVLSLAEKIARKEQLTNLPTFYIDTHNGAEVTSKEDYVEGILVVAAPEEVPGRYSDTLEIRGRGNSTWGMDKKPYRLKLKQKYQLLGMPAKAKSWPILANYADKSLLRNALAFEISSLCELYYTPAYRFVDVVLNGEFLGNYMVTDQVEVDKDRVNVDKQDPLTTTLPEIAGGYLLELDGFAEINQPAEGAIFPEGFLSRYNTPVSIKYPKDDEINQEQRDYIIDYFNQFETALREYRLGDPIDKIAYYIDIEGFVNWYIATELTSNSDCIWSIYMKKDRDRSQIVFGPLWDNDISFANDNRVGDLRDHLIIKRAHPAGGSRQLVQKMLYIPEVQRQIAARWAEVNGQALRNRLVGFVDSLAQAMDQSQQYNFQRWPILDKLVYHELEARGSYEAEVGFLRNYISDRVDWLNQTLPIFDQIFVVQPIDTKKWYAITNQLNDKVLDVKAAEGEQPVEGAPTVLWDNTQGEKKTQYFRFVDMGDGSYQILNKAGEKALEAWEKPGAGGGVTDCYLLSLRTPSPQEKAQRWLVDDLGEGVYHLKNVACGLAIDNYGGASDNGNEVNMFTSDEGNGNQQWYLQALGEVLSADLEEENSMHCNIYTTQGVLYVESGQVATLKLYTQSGTEIKLPAEQGTSWQIPLEPGIYLMKIDKKVKMIYVK